VLKKADELEIDFLIENNVLAPFNHIDSTVPVLLCVDAPEMIRLIEVKDHPRLGILLDTAHLKVSAQTLGFDMYDHAELVSPFVEVIHHSDNDGLADTNQVLGEDYWAKSTGALFHGCLHVLEVKNIDTGVINQQLALLQGIYG
jgi:sugar phosphate isomerase/epimerase